MKLEQEVGLWTLISLLDYVLKARDGSSGKERAKS